MSISYTIDQEAEIIYITATGSINIEDLVNTQKEIISHHDFKKGFNSYIDFSRARPSPTSDYDKVKWAASYVESTQGKRGKCRCSIYAPHEDPYVFSDLFSRLTEHLEIKTKVFQDEESAKAWLAT